MGDPPMNLFDCEVVREDGRAALRLGDQVVVAAAPPAAAAGARGRVRLGIRPADVKLQRAPGATDLATLPCEVVVTEPSERTVIATLRTNGVEFKLKTSASAAPSVGEIVPVSFEPTRLYLFDPASGAALGQAEAADAVGSVS